MSIQSILIRRNKLRKRLNSLTQIELKKKKKKGLLEPKYIKQRLKIDMSFGKGVQMVQIS